MRNTWVVELGTSEENLPAKVDLEIIAGAKQAGGAQPWGELASGLTPGGNSHRQTANQHDSRKIEFDRPQGPTRA